MKSTIFCFERIFPPCSRVLDTLTIAFRPKSAITTLPVTRNDLSLHILLFIPYMYKNIHYIYTHLVYIYIYLSSTVAKPIPGGIKYSALDYRVYKYMVFPLWSTQPPPDKSAIKTMGLYAPWKVERTIIYIINTHFSP